MKNNFNKKKAKTNTAVIVLISVLALAVLGVFVVPKIIYSLKPDAVISTDTLDIEFKLSGFEGAGSLTAEPKGSVALKEAKNPDVVDDILKSIEYSDISVDKSDNLKNGDTVKAVYEVSCSKYKVKFDNTKIEKEYTVENLSKLINDFSDISKEFLKEFEDFEDYTTAKMLRKGLDSSPERYANIKVEKLGYFDRKMTQEAIDELISNGETKSKYALILVKRTSYHYTFYPGFTSDFVHYSVVKATDFEYVDGKIKAKFVDEKDWTDKDQLIAGLNFNGFGLAGKEEFENKKEKIKKLAENVDGKVVLWDGNKENNNEIDFYYEIIDEANIRELPDIDAPVLVKLDKFNYGGFNVFFKKETPDGRTWYYVKSLGEEDYNYNGWVSDRVLIKGEVG